MRYMKRSNSYKASNFQFFVDTKKAYSWDWWLFSTIHKGKLIFNNCFYSMSTCKHQSKALKLLDYKYDIKLQFTKENLEDIDKALHDEINLTRVEIRDLITTIKRPRTRVKTNLERKETITKHLNHITQLRALL